MGSLIPTIHCILAGTLRCQEKMSDYAMSLDIVNQLSQSRNEKSVIDNILSLFSMLFAPGMLYSLSFQQNNPAKLYTKSGLEFQDQTIFNRLSAMQDKYRLKKSGKGFFLRVSFQDETLGMIEVDDIAFPEYIDHYSNLALFLSDIVGLAISNARTYQIVINQKEHLEDNISQLKTKEELLTRSLKEKGILLKEVNHRVKNNMTIVSSLLGLQADKIQDKQALAALENSRNRIRNMALIHEKLYKSESLADVSFDAYIRDLYRHLFESYNTSEDKIRLKMLISDVKIEVSKGIPCALIINEMISNALEHAFTHGWAIQVNSTSPT